MHISFTDPETSGKKIYDNTGSCGTLTNYLVNDHDLPNEYFFNHERNDITEEELNKLIDGNVKGLKKEDDKFISLYVSPSSEENKIINEKDFKDYVIHTVQEYAQEYNLKSNIDLKDIVWGGIIHHYRYFKGFESKVSKEVSQFKKEGLSLENILGHYRKKNSAVSQKHIKYFYENGVVGAGDKKPGNNMHAHILISTRDRSLKTTLNPNKAKYVSFSKSNFYFKSINYFSDHFKYPKSINEFIEKTHTYLDSKISRESAILFSKHGIVVDETKLKINLNDIHEKDFYVKSLNSLRKALSKQNISDPEFFIDKQYNSIRERYKKNRAIKESILNTKDLLDIRKKAESYIYYLNRQYKLQLDGNILITYSDAFEDKRILFALSSLHNRLKNDQYFPIKYDLNEYVLDIADSYKTNLKYLEYNTNYKVHKLTSYCYYLNNSYKDLNLKESTILKMAKNYDYNGKVFYSLVSLSQSLKNGIKIKDPYEFLLLKISEKKSDIVFINYLQNFNKTYGLNIDSSHFLRTIKADTETGYFILRDFNYKIKNDLLNIEKLRDPQTLLRETFKQYNYYLDIKDNVDLRFLAHPSIFYHWEYEKQLKYLGQVINSINNVHLSKRKRFDLNEILPFYSFQLYEVYKSLHNVNFWFKNNITLEENFKDVLLDHINNTVSRKTYISWDINKRKKWLNDYLHMLQFDPKMRGIINNYSQLIKENADKYKYYTNIYRTLHRVNNLAYEESIKIKKTDFDQIKSKPTNWEEYINKTFERTYFEEMAYDYGIKYSNLPYQSKVIRMDAAIDLLNDRYYLNITGAKINKEFFLELERKNNYNGKLNSAISSLTYKLSNKLPINGLSYNDYILNHMTRQILEKQQNNFLKPLTNILGSIANNPLLNAMERNFQYDRSINEENIIPKRVINRIKRKLRNG